LKFRQDIFNKHKIECDKLDQMTFSNSSEKMKKRVELSRSIQQEYKKHKFAEIQEKYYRKNLEISDSVDNKNITITQQMVNSPNPTVEIDKSGEGLTPSMDDSKFYPLLDDYNSLKRQWENIVKNKDKADKGAIDI
jgi:hypothetical protein